MVATTERSIRADAPLRALLAAPRVAATVAALAVISVHLLRGPNYVLDDWWVAAEGVVDGPLGASSADLVAARPGTAVAYGLTFGLFARHPLIVAALHGMVFVACAGLLAMVLARFLDRRLAAGVSVLWVLLPNHLSIEIWPNTIVISASLFLVLLGAERLATPDLDRRRQVQAVIALTAASLFYEASIPIAGTVAILVPLLVERRLRWRLWIAAAAGQLAVLLWLLTHWHDVKDVQELIDVSQIVPAHFGWGIVGTTFGPVLVLGALAGVLAIVADWRLGWDRLADTPARAMLGVGLVIVSVGTLPFLRYFYAPVGAGDRVLYTSSIGGVLIWGAILIAANRWRGELAVALGATLIALSVTTRWDRAAEWDRAGNDAVAILGEVAERFPERPEVVVLGPEPILGDGVAAFYDQSNVRSAFTFLYGERGVRGGIAFSQQDWETFDAEVRIDIRPLSTLEATTP